jgi:hypothetical protein
MESGETVRNVALIGASSRHFALRPMLQNSKQHASAFSVVHFTKFFCCFQTQIMTHESYFNVSLNLRRLYKTNIANCHV